MIKEKGRTVIPTDVTSASAGCTLLGIPGKYVVEIDAALKLINSYRKEACDNGYINPSTGQKLTPGDYVPIRWSADLESIARLRAAEASLTMDHVRTNGADWYAISSPNGVGTWGEVLAWNFTDSMLMGIQQWYGEKGDWLKQNKNAVTGHYTQMINPENVYVGIATFCSPITEFYNTTAGEFLPNLGSLNESKGSAVSECIQLVEINNAFLSNHYEIGVKAADARGETLSMKLITSAYDVEGLIVPNTRWASSNTKVARVNSEGLVSPVLCGTAAIIATDSQGRSYAKNVTLNHDVVIDKGYSATCDTAGKTDGKHCSVCGEILVKQTVIPAGAHKYKTTVKKATLKKKGLITRKCSICGAVPQDEVIAIPKKVSLSSSKLPYTGSVQKPSVVVTDANGKVIPSSYYTVKYPSGCKKVGTYKVTVTLKGNYSGTLKASFSITKISQNITVGKTAASVSAENLKKKAQSFSIGAKAKAKVTAKKKSGSNYLKISSAGKVTVKKGTPQGTYSMVVALTAAGNSTYTKAVTTKTITVVVE